MGTGQGQIGSSWGQYGNQSEVDPWLAKFIRAQSTSLASQEEGYSLFFDLAQKQLDEVKKCNREVQELRGAQSQDQATVILQKQSDSLQRYTGTILATARIFWDQKMYKQTAKVLQQCRDICGDEIAWQLNLAHTLFVQENYALAKEMYKKIIERQQLNSILDVTPVVLANLCVCHVMLEENEVGEEIIVRVDKEEERQLMQNPDQQ
ncbi:MAG: putative tetratricopeptide repeat protein 30A, partial [Streblomastix strix]